MENFMTSVIGKALTTIRNRAPVPYTATRGPMLPWMGGNDKTGQLDAMGQVSTLFSIVDRIANATAQVEWHLYRKQTDGRRRTATGEEEQRTEVTRHAALDLWNNPNPFMDGAELVETFDQHYELTGEGWLVVGRNPAFDLPLELWPVRPDRMFPVPSADDFLAGYIYRSPDGAEIPLGLNEVLFMRRPNPTDPYRGMGPVQAAMVDLHSARYAAEYNRAFFLNSAEPGGIIELDKRLEEDEWNEFTERWREQHQGVNAAHRVGIIEHGGKWVERRYTFRDMEFAKLRGLSREVIREAFGLHAHMLGISEDVNRANAFAGEASFGRWIVHPRAQRIKRLLNHRLLPMFGADNLEFDHDRVVPEDREADDRERTSKAQAAQLLVIAGYDPKDVSKAVGLPEMAFVGGDPDNNLANGNQGAGDSATKSLPRELAEIIQKLYLGVDEVVTWDEARVILRQAGAELGDAEQPPKQMPGIPAADPDGGEEEPQVP